MQKDLLIIIPAYNEERNIISVLDELEKPQIAEIADVLVMNDASSYTNWMVKARNHPVVTHVFNLGYGKCLAASVTNMRSRYNYKYVIQMDADGQHDVCNITNIYNKLKKSENGVYPDIVLGSRFIGKKSDYKVSLFKKFAIWIFKKIIYISTGQIIMDILLQNNTGA